MSQTEQMIETASGRNPFAKLLGTGAAVPLRQSGHFPHSNPNMAIAGTAQTQRVRSSSLARAVLVR